jgi:YfiH family protein
VFHWRERFPAVDGRGVDWGFTSIRGGSSVGDFESLNLGGRVGDDPLTVEANRMLVANAFGVAPHRLLFMNQRQGVDIVAVNSPWVGEPPQADGLVTTSTDVALAVLVADCTPVLLVDRGAGVAAAVHAGRPGMMSGIVDRAVDAMTDLGARSISAVVGPSICPRCYEVPEAMRVQAAKVTPVAAAISWQGTPAIDVAGAVVDQLRARSVAVQWIAGCSRESTELFSYRRQHRTGRFAGVVRLVAAAEDPRTEGHV